MKPRLCLFVVIKNGGDIIPATQSKNLFGLILIILGILLIFNNFDIEVFRYGWPLLVIIAGLFLIFRDARKRSGSDSTYSEFRILGDFSRDDFSGEIDGTEINHIIGDVRLNLSGVQLKPGTNFLKISVLIGDIEISIPETVAIKANGSVMIGDILILNRKHDGFFLSATEKSNNYETADKKLHINCSALIGDIKIRQL